MVHLRDVGTFMRRKRVPVAVFSIVLVCAAAGSMRRSSAQNQGVRPPNAVQRLDPRATALPSNPGDRGATYRWLEERAVRVTTRFTDAVAVSERVAGGDLRTRLNDTAGRDLGEFAVDRVAAGTDVLTFKEGEERFARAAGKPGAPLTLDWANRQAYAMWKDKAADAAVSLEWQGDLIRAKSAGSADIHRPIEVRTEWADGLAAKSAHSAGQRPHPRTGRPSRGSSFESRLTRDNLEVGRSRWYPEEQVYVWSVPGLTAGYLDAERMKDLGGWTFVPDLAWANVQTYAFHYFHGLVNTQGFVAATAPASQPWLRRVVEAVAPTLHANEPGCDGLHWLDGSIFRPCCDIHDHCYEKYGCTWKSWWEWWSGWKCVACNAGLTICIATRYPPFSPSYP